MRLRSAPILIIFAVLAIGCKSGDTTAANGTPAAPAKGGDVTPAAPAPATGENTVVGTWTNDSKDLTDSVVEFKDDGTVAVSGSPAGAKGVKVDGTGTYKVDGDKFTMQMTGEKMTAPADADAKTKSEVEEGNKAATPENMAKTPPDTDAIAWKDKDTFTLTSDKADKKVVTFTRKS
jgi:uncharacterized protein (TIGR03066 family)